MSEIPPIKKFDVSSIRAPSDMHAQNFGGVNSSSIGMNSSPKKLGAIGKSASESAIGGTRKERLKMEEQFDLMDANETEEVNDMLIDAIKAKLAILDTMDD